MRFLLVVVVPFFAQNDKKTCDGGMPHFWSNHVYVFKSLDTYYFKHAINILESRVCIELPQI